MLHEVERRVGVRQIELVKRDPQSPNGKVFYFSVNGQKLWAKGDNWLPIDFLHTRVTPEQYRSYLQLLMAGGVNLLRVWGGGIVEHDAFYEACDELGLLVWQDFQFACGIYPESPEFLAEVKREAEDIVKKLRSHSCIALWCGNNENEVLAVQTLPDKRFHPIYYDVLSSVCAALDPDRPYWPGSPAAESRELLECAALLHDVGRTRELGRGPSFRQTDEGRLLGHVHLGLRLIEERALDLDPAVLAELLHAVGCHHDRQAAKTAEAAVLYHANQLDAQAATRPVGDD